MSLGQTVVITVKFLKLNPLQQQQQNSVASFSALPYSDAVYKFMNESNYRHSSDDGGGLDFDKLEPLIDKLFELKANDWLLLIRKTLVLFSQLGCNNNTKVCNVIILIIEILIINEFLEIRRSNLKKPLVSYKIFQFCVLISCQIKNILRKNCKIFCQKISSGQLRVISCLRKIQNFVCNQGSDGRVNFT